MRKVFLALTMAGLTACQPQPVALTDAQKTALADSAKAIVHTMVANANKLDFNAYFQDYSADADTRYIENGALIPSLDAFKKSYLDLAPSFESLTNTLDATDAIVLGPDAVAITFPFHFSFKPKGRAEYEGQGLWTGLLQRRSGKWQIVQTHESWVNAEQAMAAMMGPPAKDAAKKK